MRKLVVIIFCSLLTLTGCKKDESVLPTAVGTAGSIIWTLSDDGVLTINGIGEMPNYSSYDFPPWYDNRYKITHVIIGNKVSTIGYYAFYGCNRLTSITIGNSVTFIGVYAFAECSSLTSITIPNSIKSIGSYAFRNSGLTSITIPNSVNSIGNSAFSGCSSLTSVIIPNSVNSIGHFAFLYCTGITSVTIGNSVTSIGDWAFEGYSSLTEIINERASPQAIRADLNIFNKVDISDCTLRVPAASINA